MQDKTRISLYIPTNLLNKIEQKAKQENRSRNNTIETLLTKSLITP